MSLDFFNERPVKSRKKHRCDSCLHFIEMGSLYCYMAFKSDGDFFTIKNHLECRAAECGLAELHGLYGGEDWISLNNIEDEDLEWIEVNHPKAYARIKSGNES